MPTKTEYREYISSPEWQARRKEFLLSYPECNRCSLPKWLAVIAYDQDLHVHHRSYTRVGHEKDEDLEPLCKRCHEIETFGNSSLHKPQHCRCTYCGHTTWRTAERVCDFCYLLHPAGGPGVEEDQWDCSDTGDGTTVAEHVFLFLRRKFERTGSQLGV